MSRRVWTLTIAAVPIIAGGVAGLGQGERPPPSDSSPAAAAGPDDVRDFVGRFCVDCHNRQDKTGGLSLDDVGTADIGGNPEVWEKVVRKLTLRQMPPRDVPRPDERTYDAVVARLAAVLDEAAARRPDPGRTETFRRLTRTEYQNAVRDLLALDVDVATLLPPDESSHGFDNVTVADLSPTLVSRYIVAAEKFSRLAVGGSGRAPGAETVRIRPDITQDVHIDGLPIGTRGGALIPYNFPRDGEYEIQVRLMRDRNEEVEGLSGPHDLEVLLDRERIALFTVGPPPKGESDKSVDADLKTRVEVAAGPHDLGVTFLRKSSPLLETMRQPLNVHFNYYRHPRIGPALYEVTITGPFDAGVAGDTPSRRRIFTCEPTGDEDECARRILGDLMRRAFRRPVEPEEFETPLEFFRQGRAQGGFDAGIEAALAAVLVNPHFLFRIERDPPMSVARLSGSRDPAARPSESPGLYRVSDVELASRLSFFLWSSIPDDELLDLAAAGELSRHDVLDAQVRRMLADERSRSLVTNFAGQWLYVRNLESATPDMRLFPDFDHNLREAFRRETELAFESILREDRSVLDLIESDDTYLNERLAKHYGVPHVYGSRFRRVALDGEERRGGLLRHGSILTVTSYATRTSPVLRGKWVLENLLGAPPPPPPENVPALADNTVSATLSVRERLSQHRANAACAGCHDQIDPVGFALENFDATGRWRDVEEGQPVDASGGLPDGREFTEVSGLEQALRERPDLFVRTLAEKLLTFALGRGVESTDAPAIRGIVREARENDYRFSSLVLGIARSTPFQMRRSP
jgi:hypothetical protein